MTMRRQKETHSTHPKNWWTCNSYYFEVSIIITMLIFPSAGGQYGMTLFICSLHVYSINEKQSKLFMISTLS